MKKQSWLKQYFWTYLLIAMIPVALFTLLFSYTGFTSYKTEVESNRYAAFSQFVGSLDNMLGKMDTAAQHLTDSNMDWNALLANSESFSQKQAEEIGHKLAAYQNQLLWDAKPLLFIRGAPYIYTTDGLIEYQIFQENMLPYGNMDLSGFFTSLSTANRQITLKLVHNPDTGNASGDAIAILYPIPYMDVVPQATLCFVISKSVIVSMFENCVSDVPGNLYLLSDIYQENLRSIQDEALDTGDVPILPGTGVLQTEHAGEKCFMLRAVLQNANTSVIFLCNQRMFYSHMNPFWRAFGFALLMVLCMAVTGAFLLTRRSYSPLRKLLKDIHSNEKGNEFEQIRAHVYTVENQNSALNEQLVRQRPLVVEACVSYLLQGKYSSRSDMEMQIHCAGLDFSNRSSFVLAIGLQAETGCDYEAAVELLHAYLDTPLTDNCLAYMVSDERERLATVLVTCPQGKDVRQALAKEVLTKMKGQVAFPVLCGAGSLCMSPEELHASCMEALAVVQEYLPACGKSFACYDPEAQSEQHCVLPTLNHALLTQSLKLADTQMAQKALEQLMEEIRRTEFAPFCQCMCFDVVNQILRSIQTLMPEYDMKLAKGLCTFHGVEEFYQEALQLIADFCRQYSEIRTEHSNKSREEMIAYVTKHVYDSNFGLAEVAEAFHLSQSYLSRFYKAETGYTFIQYVTMLRMDRAKRLLTETSLSVKEIVEQIGYIDTASFTRKFKLCEGITPSQWRGMYHQVNE